MPVGKVGERLNSPGHVEQDRVGVVVHRQVDTGVTHGGHRRAGMRTGGRKVSSEGVPKGVNVHHVAAFVLLRDPCGSEVGVEDADRWGVTEQTGIQRQIAIAQVLPEFVHYVFPQGDVCPAAVLGVFAVELKEWRRDGVQTDLPDGQAGQFLAP